jgi:hypothetical protein
MLAISWNLYGTGFVLLSNRQMKQIICAILIHFVLCSFISAYEGPKSQVFGAIGLSLLDDARDFNDNLNNASFGFGIAYRKLAHVGFRGDLNYFSDSRDRVAYPYDIHLWDFGADIIYYFSDSRHQPYTFGGARILNYHQVSDAPSLSGVFETAVNSLGIDFGVGIQSFITRSISIRPEFRFVYDTDLDEHNNAHSNMFSLTGAVAYHW